LGVVYYLNYFSNLFSKNTTLNFFAQISSP
jgi:hypothetical protein